MKLKGLPYTVTKDDILKFFHGLGLVEDSVKIGTMSDGKLTGEASCLFETPEDCQQAHQNKNQQHIGSRWINLIMIPEEEYNDFENNQKDKFEKGYYGGYGGGGGSRGGRGRGRGRGRGGSGYGDGGYGGGRGGGGGYSQGKTVRLSDFVNPGNQNKTLKMRGLPYSIGVREIRDFFCDFRVSERDIILDLNNGNPTGYALVFLESEEEAARAKAKLHKQYLGNRYVDLTYPDMR